MALGNSTQIIVGAAQLWTANDVLAPATVPSFVASTEYATTLDAATDVVRNVGYTMNGLEIQFQPDFGEVQVDQVLDVAKLYKQGMQVNLNTTFAESTLENLLLSIAGSSNDLGAAIVDAGNNNAFQYRELNLASGNLGECPVERGLIAVGPGTGDCAPDEKIERVYTAYRALSIDNVTVSAKRDEATMFEVSFRLLPDDNSGSYGKIVDRAVSYTNVQAS